MKRQFTFVLMMSFLATFSLKAQSIIVKGAVCDSNREPLIGASVMVQGTQTGTTTLLDGTFELEVEKPQSQSLEISYFGFVTQKVPVNGRTVIKVVLHEDVKSLEELVVVGYGVQKKALVTGANLNVKGEDITKLNTSNAMDALKGNAPGLNITQNNAQPGAGTRITIRGMGTTGNSTPLFIVDGVHQSNIDYLSPSDIESIDVLKDAASAAIYGSRGANGVILVTTKKGTKNSKATVTYDAYHGWSNVYKRPDLLNAQEYVQIKDEARINSGLGLYNWADNVPNFDKIMSGEIPASDWFGEAMVKNAQVKSHSVGISGGGKSSVYSLGFSYYDQEGVMGAVADPSYNRLTVRLNTEYTLFKRAGGTKDLIKIGENLTYTNTRNNARIRQGNMYWNDIMPLNAASPLWAIYDENGEYSQPFLDPLVTNPMASIEHNGKYGENDGNTIVGNVYLTITPIDGLTIQSRYGINMWFGGNRSWTPTYNLGNTANNAEDDVNQGMWYGYSWIQDNTITYDFNLGDNNFSVMVGNSMEYTPRNYNISASGEATLFQTWDNAYLNNATKHANVQGTDYYGDAGLSYFGRINYDYKEKYMLSALVRADGSSNFAPENRWGVFPSVSAGWVVTNESFMEGTKGWLDFLKPRVSWGQVGNASVSPFLYSSTIGYTNKGYYNSSYLFGNNKGVAGTEEDTRLPGSYPTRLPNKDISWETSEQLNVGVDASLFDSRMRFTFDWYNKTTKDWLVWTNVPASNGINGQMVNGGAVSNKGVELSLSWNDQVGDFSYSISGSYSHNKNMVTEIANTEGIIHGSANVMKQGMSEIYRAEEGFPIGYFYGYETDGILQNKAEVDAYVAPAGAANAGDKYFADQVPGDVRFVDQNGDGMIDDDDKMMLGDPTPDHIVGLQVNLDYKGIFLNLAANGAFGHQIATSVASGNSNWGNSTTAIFDRWHGEGTSTTQPRLTFNQHPRNDLWFTENFIQDADYFKISNITIGYDFKRLFPEFAVISEAKLYFTLQNFFTFTNYDGLTPEVGFGGDSWSSGIDTGAYPAAKTMMVGLNIKF